MNDFNLPYIDYTGRPLVGVREYNGLVFISGHGCEDQVTGEGKWTGCIGDDMTFEEGYEAARWCGMLHLGLLRNHYGLDQIDSIVRAYGLFRVADDFYDLDKLFDGYSDVMYTAFRERGKHVRTVMGTRNLPNHNISVEVETIVKLK